MSIPMFPDRLRRRHRAPISPEVRAHRARALRYATGGVLVALALVAVVVLHDVPIAALITGLLLAVVGLVVVDPGRHLLATVAPLPPVWTAPKLADLDIVEVVAAPRPVRPEPYADPLLATAEDAGVYVPRHACHTPTSVIPQVQA